METQVIYRHDRAFVETENKETENKDNMKESETDYKALYEETISKLKIAKESVGCYTFSEVIDKVIPEVAENDDERTRNEIIAFVETSIHRGGGTPIPEEQENKWLAWLEKQKTTEEALRYLKENHSPSEVSDFQAAMNIAVAKAYNKGYADGLEKQGGQKPADKVESISKDDEDESIIKDIIAYMRYERKSTGEEIENRFIPWLEKQGERKEIDYNEELKKCRANPLYFFDKYVKVKLNEQKPADKVEPKFKVGDSIKTANEEPLTITEITDNGYWSEDLFICNFDDAAKWELVEKKPADKVKPKFKAGDWIIKQGITDQIALVVENVTNHTYGYDTVNGEYFNDNTEGVRLWSIRDAKDGDVLVVNNEVFIYAHRKQMYSIAVAHCFVDGAGDFYFDGEFGYTEKGNSIHPATKEQHDLLFSKMKDAGYEWDAEDKVLKKIEQKSADTPKFKVGDWVVQGKMLYQIEKITDLPGNHFQYWTTDGVWFGDGTEAHLWTIQDAKDGDVLAWYDSKCIALFKEEIHDNDSFKSYGFVGACTGVFEDGGFHDIEDAHPATQEQCDLLFSKMKEAGYEWDAEKKELKKIEPNPTWSEKDESMLTRCMGILGKCYMGELPTKVEEELNWLKSLPDKVRSQPKKELNEDAVNEYVDLGLSSGTLWKSVNEEGYYTFDEAVEKFGHNLPTKEQWDELKDNCDWVWKGAGYEVTGPNGNTIYLSATGYRYGTVVYDLDTDGNYWSCIQHDDADHVYYLCFDDRNIHMDYSCRNYGQSIRLVNR